MQLCVKTSWGLFYSSRPYLNMLFVRRLLNVSTFLLTSATNTNGILLTSSLYIKPCCGSCLPLTHTHISSGIIVLRVAL